MEAIKDSSKKETWKMFDLIAKQYDLLNRLLSMGIDKWWRFQLGKKLPNLGHQLDILDIATGTGDVGLSFLRHQSDRINSIIGSDLSEEMLAIAEKKIKRIGESRMTIQKADATNLPFDDAQFDATSIAFGIRNVPDVPKALKEMNRVLNIAGRSLILEFSIPSLKPLKALYLFYFRHILPFVGGLISGNRKAYVYLNESVEAFPEGEAFCQLMRDAGFKNVKQTRLTFGIATIYQGDKS